MIENRLFLSRHQRGVCLHLHTHAEGIGTVVEGLLALSEDGWIVGANRAALQLLGLHAGDLGATPITRVLDCHQATLIGWGRRHPQQPRSITSQRGQPLFVSVSAGSAPLRSKPPASVPVDALAALNTGDKAMATAIDRGRRVLGKAIPILLHGKSGVGKELFACALHTSGPRHQGPFVAVNCAALPENLIEAELFNYAADAFTGASRNTLYRKLKSAAA